MPDTTKTGTGSVALTASTPEQIAASLWKPAWNNTKPATQAGLRAALLGCVQSRFVPPYTEKSCASSQSYGGGLAIAGGAESLGLNLGVKLTTGILQSSIPIIGSLIGIFTAIFQHHAMAVKAEQSVLCRAIPGVNQFLTQLDAEIEAGTINFDAAILAMEKGYANWVTGVQGSGIMHDSAAECNAACDYAVYFRACIEVRKSEYATAAANLQSGSNRSVVQSASALVTAGGSQASGSAVALPWYNRTGLILAGTAALVFVAIILSRR